MDERKRGVQIRGCTEERLGKSKVEDRYREREGQEQEESGRR